MRHVLVMTGAASVGLVAMFAVDVVDLYFITLLGEQRLVAAVGYAGTLLYFLLSLGIGLLIALGALVARAEGAGDREGAGRICSSVLWFNLLSSSLLSALAWWQLPELLRWLGASGETLEFAIRYARIQLPVVPVMVLGMSLSAGLRAIGDARRSMVATLAAALANAVLDPLFIFTFGWGLDGAAWASVVARIVMFLYGAHALYRIHHLPRPVTPAQFRADTPAIVAIGLPAVLTNLATPLGNSVVLKIMSQFGDSAVAALAVMARLAPLAFAAVFAVSGAVGPIVGQNAGACRYDRVRQTLIDASLFVLLYVALVWLVIWLLLDQLLSIFTASAQAAELLAFYMQFLVGFFALNGLLFVANASFNNLGRAYLATCFNYSKVFLGMVPAAYVGARYFDARGVMVGESAGMAVWGLLGMFSALWMVRRLERDCPERELPQERRESSGDGGPSDSLARPSR